MSLFTTIVLAILTAMAIPYIAAIIVAAIIEYWKQIGFVLLIIGIIAAKALGL